CQQSNSWPTTF
nr:immunoglobulin light chain junction region [Mus musculus]NSM02268.1 immunoglobulin light chain junction region [Mus musculus]